MSLLTEITLMQQKSLFIYKGKSDLNTLNFDNFKPLLINEYITKKELGCIP